MYDYPGLYPNKGRGEHLTMARMQEEEAQITTIRGASDCRAFTTGYRFTLQDYYRQDMNNKAYVLMRLEHEAYQGASYPGEDAAAPDFVYSNSFECIPYDVPFRPLRRAEKPLVFGTQTAVVVGPSGDEIYTDDLGRIKVQFHWDRKGNRDQKSSCWIRVGQLWAGPKWGAVFIPRIGQEVIVDFLEGDPDRPLVVGCVYHKSNLPPLDLPGEKTRSTIKSDSTIGGGGFNEIRFEDKKGQEEIYIHAQKDKTVDVGNNRTVTIHNNDTLTVEKGNRKKTVKEKDDIQEVTLGSMQVTVPVGSYALAANSVSIDAQLGIKITCGSSSIELLPAMITIKSPMVKIN